MHQDRTHHFIGTANESIDIDSSAPTSGALQLSFDGSVLGALPQTVQFSPTPGLRRTLVATLTGPSGSHCALSIDNVDGGKDLTILSVGGGTFHDTVILEFLAAAPVVTSFMAGAGTRVV
jgi:hypothetical protein